jgi:U4/U6.U5 tri-snRNP component SNU23
VRGARARSGARDGARRLVAHHAARPRAERIEEEERKALAKQKKQALVLRAALQARDAPLDLVSNLNKVSCVRRRGRRRRRRAALLTGAQHVSHSAASALSERGGYYCKVCEVHLKDSNSYLDHMNGRKHHQKLGMSMLVEVRRVNQAALRASAAR